MINQLIGFFSTQRQQLKGWELPLAGLLLTAGLAVSVATVKTTASQHKEQAVNSIAVPSTLETAESQPQEPAVESPASPAAVTAEPQSQEPVVEPPVVPSAVTVEPLPQEPAVDAPVLPSNLTAKSQLQEPSVESPPIPPTVTAAEPQSQELAVEPAELGKPSIKWNRKAQESRKPNIAQAPNPEISISDGTYLYGQSAQPGELGKEYIVFQARQGKVIGAMYMPSSEYACFYGTLNSKQMNLTVVNPYDQTSFSHTIARAQPAQLAAVGGSINIENTYDSLTYPHSVGLDGYQPISQVSDNDKQILSNCLNKYQAQVWNH